MLINLGHLEKTRNFISLIFRLMIAYFQLLFRGKPPEIKSFEYDAKVAIEGGFIEINWDVKNCYKVVISGIGTFVRENHAIIKVPIHKTLILTAYGIRRSISKKIEINKVNIDNYQKVEIDISKELIFFKDVTIPTIVPIMSVFNTNIPSPNLVSKSLKTVQFKFP